MADAIKTTTTPAESMKLWRERMGYSIGDAANELGYTEKQITAWEKGDEMPRAIRLAMAALAMGMEA